MGKSTMVVVRSQEGDEVKGIDFDKTFTPVVKLVSLHIILTITAEKDLELHQIDVKLYHLSC